MGARAEPSVRIEVRQGKVSPVTYVLTEYAFLVGSVPGCDLRLPGAELPPVMCLITRSGTGVWIRKLPPIFPIQVNDRPITTTPIPLINGDRVLLNGVELLLHVSGQQATPGPGASLSDGETQKTATPSPTAPAAPGQAEAGPDIEAKLSTYRRKLQLRYRKQRDRLAGLREAVRHAARKVQEQKKQLEVEMRKHATTLQEKIARQNELKTQADELARQKQLLEEQRALLQKREQQLHQELANRLAECQARERTIDEEARSLERNQAQYRADLVRLDRLESLLEQREKQLQQRAREVDRRFEELQRDSREVEEQAKQLDEWHARLCAQAEQLEKDQANHKVVADELAQRTAALEGQQAMLAALRTRLEKLREDLRRDEQQLAEQRGRLVETEAELQHRLQEAQRLQTEWESRQQLQEQERQRFEERSATLEAAVAQLRQAQDALKSEQEKLAEVKQGLEQEGTALAEQAALLHARSEQLETMQERLTAERQTLRNREASLNQAEQKLADFQEQLRRRADELAAQSQALSEADAAVSQATEPPPEWAAAQAELTSKLAEVEAIKEQLAARRKELDEREHVLRRHIDRLKEAGRAVAGERKALLTDRASMTLAEQQLAEKAQRAEAELRALRAEVVALQRQLPELELKAQAAVERLTLARTQLRDHLAEVHAFTRQNREELQAIRAQLQAEAERLRQQDMSLQQARDDHRLAMASFRQQLIDWQGQVAEMKQSLAQKETRLGMQQAQVNEQVRQIDATSARLARQVEELQEQERVVDARRSEMESHLEDMREWYRRKLRELAASRDGAPATAGNRTGAPAMDGKTLADRRAASRQTTQAGILSLTEEIDPGDRKLGELLRSLQLIDDDTLTALLVETRKKRRSLRQALLTSGCLTLYQMALIEAGNVDGLVLGPVRVVDRLRATAHEIVYRVFDPRHGREAVLRHLTEAEAEDAIRPDVFRQFFTQAASVQHPNLAATLEILEINGRPAVLQEWLLGLASSEWPPLIGVAGVWYRLVYQAASGLAAAHQAGLVHGHLHAGRVLLNSAGVVKLCGFGEPWWLVDMNEPDPAEWDTPADLTALGQIAASWAAFAPQRKGAGKPWPESLHRLLRRLTADSADKRYESADAILAELERIKADIPPNPAAWDRLLRYVRDQVPESAERLSA